MFYLNILQINGFRKCLYRRSNIKKKKKKTKTMSVSVQVDNIKETICHIMLSIKTQTKYIYFYCLCIAYSLSNQKWPNMHRLSRFGGSKANLLDCRAGNQLNTA